ncbi:CbrC family protein [Streptomyces netropsis]
MRCGPTTSHSARNSPISSRPTQRSSPSRRGKNREPKARTASEALAVLRQELADASWPPTQTEQYLSALSKDGQPTAYLFRCRSCGSHLAYSDAT